jgi:hypothetical protein
MKYLLFIISILTIIFTSLVSIPDSPFLIGGMTQADISNMFPSAITPAGFTFSIWWLIYISWILAGISLLRLPIRGFLEKYSSKLIPFLLDTTTPKTSIITFSSAILLTAVWLIPWGNLWIGTSLVVMIGILGLLKYTFHTTRQSSPLVKMSAELSLGWINIATVANVTIWLLSLGFTGAGIPQVYWAIGVLFLALGLTLIYQIRYRSSIISLVFIWTMFGEWVAHENALQRGFVIFFGCVTIGGMVYDFLKTRKNR